jgi:serine/threonine protein kinase
MGVVYLAQDPVLGRKSLPDLVASDPERVRRFEREARLLASLSHPNIATIHSLGMDGGRRFITLEFIPGNTCGRLWSSETMHIEQWTRPRSWLAAGDTCMTPRQ